MTGFSVEIDDLTRHASSVDQIRSAVAEAQSAGESVQLHGGAFGKMCGFLIGSVESEDRTACSALASTGTALASTATDLRAMAADYQASDEAAAARMAELMTALDASC